MGIAEPEKRFIINSFIFITTLLITNKYIFMYIPHFASGELEYSVTSKTLQLIRPKTEKENLKKDETPTEGDVLSRKTRYLLFPEGSSAGILVDLSVPLGGLPLESVFLSMNFESNYNLLDNVTQLPQAYIDGNQFSKRRAYDVAEGWLSSLGLNGKACLLRTICEATENTLVLDSLAAEIIQLIFTPSSSSGEQLNQEIREAERLGRALSSWDFDGRRSDVNCTTAYPTCPKSPFDLFTAENEGNGRG